MIDYDLDKTHLAEVPTFIKDQFNEEQADNKARKLKTLSYEYFDENLLVVEEAPEGGFDRKFYTWYPAGEGKMRTNNYPYPPGFDIRAQLSVRGIKEWSGFEGYHVKGLLIAGETQKRDLFSLPEFRQEAGIIGPVGHIHCSLTQNHKLEITTMHSRVDKVDINDRENPKPKALLEGEDLKKPVKKTVEIGGNTYVIEVTDNEVNLGFYVRGKLTETFSIPLDIDIQAKLDDLAGEELLKSPNQGPTEEDERWNHTDILSLFDIAHDSPRQPGRHVIKLAS